MISGSSAIHNINNALVTEPHIRATLKYNSFIGKGWSGAVSISPYDELKSILFNNKYIFFSGYIDGTTSYILTYEAGGSVSSIYGLSVTGPSMATHVLSNGCFVDAGSTLHLYFITFGSTTPPGPGRKHFTEINRVSTSNGTTWSGLTMVSYTVNNNISYGYNVVIGGTNEMYVLSTERGMSTIDDYNTLRYVLI